eukprot:6181256-Pleurochrysis_carterae.AAC.3
MRQASETQAERVRALAFSLACACVRAVRDAYAHGHAYVDPQALEHLRLHAQAHTRVQANTTRTLSDARLAAAAHAFMMRASLHAAHLQHVRTCWRASWAHGASVLAAASANEPRARR